MPPQPVACVRVISSYVGRGPLNSGRPGIFGSVPPISGASRAKIFRFPRSHCRRNFGFT